MILQSEFDKMVKKMIAMGRSAAGILGMKSESRKPVGTCLCSSRNPDCMIVKMGDNNGNVIAEGVVTWDEKRNEWSGNLLAPETRGNA